MTEAHDKLKDALQKLANFAAPEFESNLAWQNALKKIKEKLNKSERGSLERVDQKYHVSASGIIQFMRGAIKFLQPKVAGGGWTNELAAIANPQSPHMKQIHNAIQLIGENCQDDAIAQRTATQIQTILDEVRGAFNDLPLQEKNAATKGPVTLVTGYGQGIILHFMGGVKNEWHASEDGSEYQGNVEFQCDLKGLRAFMFEGNLIHGFLGERSSGVWDVKVIDDDGKEHTFNFKPSNKDAYTLLEAYSEIYQKYCKSYEFNELKRPEFEKEILGAVKQWEEKYPPLIPEKNTIGFPT
jgi:hypothetical protein